MQGVVGTLQGLLCRYEEREERLRRALNRLSSLVRDIRGGSDRVSITGIEGILDGVARQETLEGLVGEVGERGTAGTVHQRLTALENATTGVARADVVAQRLNEIESGEIGRDDVLSGRLTELEDATTGVARANTVAQRLNEIESGEISRDDVLGGRLTALEHATTGVARADVLGTPSPLTGMHLWVTSTMGLVIAQARADEMLDRNGTPEPIRTILRNQMTDVTSSLRPDRPADVGWRQWSERGHQNQSRRFLTATHLVVYAGDRSDLLQIIAISPTGLISITGDEVRVPEQAMVVSARPGDYDSDYRADSCIALEGEWTVSGWTLERTQTDEKMVITGDIWKYTTRAEELEPPEVENLESFPRQTEWHVIISNPG